MFDYTYVAGQRVLRNIKRISLVFNIVTQAISILILAYISITGGGVLFLNIPLLAISVAYLIFYCITAGEKKNKELKKRVKLFFKWSRRAIKLVNLGVMLYALFTNPTPTTFDVVLVCFSLGCWVIDIVFEIAVKVVKSWLLLMWEALKADAQTLIAPLTATKNFFRSFTGKEETATPPPTKERILLDGLVAERKEELEQRKEAQKAKVAQLKEEGKLAAAELKRVAKEEKRAQRAERKAQKKGKKGGATGSSSANGSANGVQGEVAASNND